MDFSFAATAILAVSLVASTGPGGAPQGEDHASELARWGETLEVDPRVVGEIERYSREENDLGKEYPARIASDMRRLIFRDAARGIEKPAPQDGKPVIEVDYLEAGFAGQNGAKPDSKHQREFEQGFIRIEVSVFIAADGVSPREALEEYSSSELRMKASSRIARIWEENDLSCVEVKGVKALLSPTLACNRIEELARPGLAAEHSQVVSNPGGGDYQTVYFKESIKTFTAVPGGLALHYINYTRAVKLGSIKRAFGRGKIEESEQKKIEELQHRLANG